MPIHNLLEIKEYTSEGYKPVVDYESWRVAILNYCEELLPQNIDKMQKHEKTDEVFLLLKGNCILFLADGDKEIEKIYAKNMEPLKVYNVKRSVWHTHTLTKNTVILIVENKNTSSANSPEKSLTDKQQDKLVKLTETLWGK